MLGPAPDPTKVTVASRTKKPSEFRKVESNAQHTFNMLKQSLEGQIAADTKDMEEEKSGKEAAQEQKSADEGRVFHSSSRSLLVFQFCHNSLASW